MKWVHFDGMAWPSLEGLDETEWQLRYGIEPPRLDVASVVAAYKALVLSSQAKRNHICKQIVAGGK
jgi:hypothetical protein